MWFYLDGFKSCKSNAIPIKFATGAKVIYRLFKPTRNFNLPSTSTTRPLSMLPVASEPLLGPVNPKHGIHSPDANLGKNGNRTVGSLYDLIRAENKSTGARGKNFKGVGNWNNARILVNGGEVEHWLNHVKVVEYNRFSQVFESLVEKSKYEKWEKEAIANKQIMPEAPEMELWKDLQPKQTTNAAS